MIDINDINNFNVINLNEYNSTQHIQYYDVSNNDPDTNQSQPLPPKSNIPFKARVPNKNVKSIKIIHISSDALSDIKLPGGVIADKENTTYVFKCLNYFINWDSDSS